MYNEKFWLSLEKLIRESEIVIDRPKGSKHPRLKEIVYEVDYGYLKGTSSGDGEGIDLWLGSDKDKKLEAIMCTIDLDKKDTEIKLLIGCTEREKEKIYAFHNQLDFIGGILVRRLGK
jgi:inorganic pyrophosphatase